MVLSKLSPKSPRAGEPPAASLRQIKLGKVWVPPKMNSRSQGQRSRAEAAEGQGRQWKRRLAETSESSSQDSSSDSEDPSFAMARGFSANRSPERSLGATIGANTSPELTLGGATGGAKAIPSKSGSPERSLGAGAMSGANRSPDGVFVNPGNIPEPQPGPSGLGGGAGRSTSPGRASPPGSAAPRSGMPSIRPNSMRNRQKQLEALKRYEERIKQQMAAQKMAKNQQPGGAGGGASGSDSDPDPDFIPSCLQRIQNPMYIHVLDISQAITQNKVSWQCLPMDAEGEAPEETILYSLVYGRGELIMFGGIQTDPNSMQMGMSIKPQVVSNKLHFIRSQLDLR